MDNTNYIALSKQAALFRQMDVIANNIANANTPGFQGEEMHFSDYMVSSSNNQKLDFTNDDFTVRNMDEGEIVKTGRPLDVAISGQGYFSVQTPLGTRYTRAGNFQLDPNNQLVTQQGYPILNDAGVPITLDSKDTNIQINSDGTINSRGQVIAKIGVVDFAAPQLLQKTGGSLYSSDADPTAVIAPKVTQGAIESSNVSTIKALTAMIEVQQGVSDTSNLISNLDTMKRNAVQTISKQG